jgi:hypothetical protein
MGQDGKRGYRFGRQQCPGCNRDIAVSYDPDGKHVWFRRHLAGIRIPGSTYHLPACHVRCALRKD